MVAFAVCGLLVAVELISGFVLQPASIFLAVLPLAAVGATVLWVGRFSGVTKTEWLWLFLCGSVVAAGVAGVLNVLAVVFVVPNESVAAVVVAPLVEESLKLLGVILLWRLRRSEDVLNMVVAGCAVAVGFAFTENVGYFAVESDLVAEFFSRGVASPFAHPLFTGISCVGLALLHKTGKMSRAVFCVLAAMLLHASWNFFVVYKDGDLMGSYYLYAALPVFVTFSAALLRLRALKKAAHKR